MRKTISLLIALALMWAGLPSIAEVAGAPFEAGGVYSGFMLKEEGELPNMSAAAYLFEHVRTGARLLQIRNGDDNRSFSVNFKCPTPDNTGIKHVIEHCVLEGSDKYPVRGTFNELMRTSMASFLNAFTNDDATSYPFATRNMKEYWGLMDVYLNTVYHPLMNRDGRIMQKEGWRYQFEDDGSVTFNGTVYNEMIGRNADPNRKLYESSFSSLFPDSPYRFNAGGVREFMPDLTQQAMIEYHRTHFTPENSYMVVYGDIDTMELLGKLDASCISDFERTGAVIEMGRQAPFEAPAESHDTLPAEAGSPAMTAASLSFLYGDASNIEQSLALKLLMSLLTGSESAPLRMAMNEAGFPKTDSYLVESQQMALIIQCIGSQLADTAAFKDAAIAALTQIADEGFDRDYLEGALNNTKLNFRLALMPGEAQVGLSVDSWIANGWMYGADPIAMLNFDGLLDSLCQKALEEGYFEQLIRDALLSNGHSSSITFTSDPDMKAKEDARVAEKAAALSANWTDEDVAALKAQLADLDAWSAASATAEELATLPRLTIDDVDTSLVQRYRFAEKDAAGVRTLHNRYDTNGVGYVSLMFDAGGVPETRTPYAALLCAMLGELDTQNHTKAQLITKIYQDTGSIGFAYYTWDREQPDAFTPYAMASGYALVEKLPQMLDLMAEIVLRTQLTDAEVKAAIQRYKTNWEMGNSMPTQLTINRAMSYLRADAAYQDAISGVDYYRFLTDLNANFDQKRDEIMAALEAVRAELFTRSNLLASVTMSDQDYPAFTAALPAFTAQFPQGALPKAAPQSAIEIKNEGFTGAFGGNTVVQVGKLDPAASKGAASVARDAINNYLTRVVRDQGGAYGGQCTISDRGDYMAFLSYFDPHLKETFDAYASVPDMLRNLTLTETELNEFKMTSLNEYMAPMGPGYKGAVGLNMYLMGKDQADLDAEVQSILDAALSDVQALADPIERLLAQQIVCVIGPQDSLNRHKDLFKTVAPLMAGEDDLPDVAPDPAA